MQLVEQLNFDYYYPQLPSTDFELGLIRSIWHYGNANGWRGTQ